jgi:hypothetical protein
MVLIPSGYATAAIATLSAALPQQSTNGNSKLGTEMAPVYDHFLTNNPLPDGAPWGHRTARQSNPYKDMPRTGVTRYYDWTIDKKTLAPDGFGSALFPLI